MGKNRRKVQRIDVQIGTNSGMLIIGDRNVANETGDTTIRKRSGGPPRVRPRVRPKERADPSRADMPLDLKADLAELARWAEAGRPVQLVGRRGSGRTTLLTHLTARCVERGTDVVFLDAAGADADDVVQDLFRACYGMGRYRPRPPELRRLMASIQALVVIDDFTGTPADLDRLLRLVPSGTLVVSSSRRLPWKAGQTVEIGGLAPRPAMELVERCLRRPLTDEERAAAERFHALVDGHPLALTQAAAALGNRAGALSDQRSLVDALATGLTENDHAVLRVLHALDGLDVPWPMVEKLIGSPLGRDTVDRLTAARLLAEEGTRLRALAPGATLVVDSAGRSPDTARRAATLAGWVRTATDREIGDAAAIIVRVLELTAAEDEHGAALALARAAAPALCRTLKWGSWRRVLAVGAESARATGSTGDAAYFEREERTRRRALARGFWIGTAAGSGFLLGRRLAAHQGPAGGVKGCLVAPGALTAFTAAAVAILFGAVGYATSPEPGRNPANSGGAAPTLAIPTFPAPTPSPRATAPSTTGPSPRALPRTPPPSRPAASPPARKPPPTTRTPRTPPTTAARVRPPEMTSAEGFWSKDGYMLEFPANADKATWSNIVLSYEEEGEWKWRYDCNAADPVPLTERDPVPMTCWLDGGEKPSPGTVTRTAENSVRLIVEGDPEVSGFYHRSR